jgi:O-Antigen ligase
MTTIPINLDSAAGHVRNAAAPYSDNVRRKLLIVFLVALLLPIQPELGGQRLDPYRLLLLVLFLPFVAAMLKRRAGQFTISDGLMGCYALWIVVTLVFHHGMARFAYASIWATMLLGGYMAGRLLIRNAQDYRRFIRYFLILLLTLLPFTLFELVTERMIIAEMLEKVVPATAKYYETRYGLSRVQVVFPHSILYGLFCSMGFANVLYLYRDQFFGRLSRLGLVVGMTIMALSSAPLLSIGLQSIMAAWDKVTRGKWMTLAVGVAAIYIFLSLASNRGPVIILIEKLTFNPSTAWWRVYIWEYGVQNVMNHPFLGLGLNDWARPYWLASTVDNFWLLTAMQAGIPALAFLVTALVVNVFHIVRAKNLTAQARDVRTGYLVVLAGSAFTLSTVHVWDAMAVFIMFYFGAGSFLFTSPPEGETGAVKDTPQREAASRYTRDGNRAPAVYARTHTIQKDKAPAPENALRKTPQTYSRRINSDQETASKLTRREKKGKI